MRCRLRSSSWREQVVEELAGGARARDARGAAGRDGAAGRGLGKVGVGDLRRWLGGVGQLVRGGQLDAELVLEALAQLVDVLVAVLDRLAQALDRALAQLVLVELLLDVVERVLDLVGRAALRLPASGADCLRSDLALARLLLLGRGELAAGRGRVGRRDASAGSGRGSRRSPCRRTGPWPSPPSATAGSGSSLHFEWKRLTFSM